MSDRARPRVAVTRAAADNPDLVERLAALGFDAVAVPLIEVIEPADDGAALVAAIDRLERYRWVVLTSANGVRAVADRRGPEPPPWPDGVEVAVVGPATAAAAQAAGLPISLVSGIATAAALVDDFLAADPIGGEVLAPLAELAGQTVTDGLAAKGWAVDRVEAYRTVAPDPVVVDPSDADPAGVEIATFFSPSVVDRWVDRYGAAGPTAVCIGPATAARATDRGLAPVVMADPHTEDGVLEAVARLRDAPTLTP